MAYDLSKSKDFSIKTIENWNGYISARDKTNVAENVMVEGSKNIYKNLAGNLSVRPGLKGRGVNGLEAVASPCSSEYVFITSSGTIYTLVVANSTLYAVTTDNIWYTIQSSLTKTRYVFDVWFDSNPATTSSNSNSKLTSVFVNGTNNLYSWSGGLYLFNTANGDSSSANTLAGIGASISLTSTINLSVPASATSYVGQRIGLKANTSAVFNSNPTNGQNIIFIINGVAIQAQFVSVIGVAAGNVLIGATTADTITNLKGLLQNPQNTTATQVALSNAQGEWAKLGYVSWTGPIYSMAKGSGTWAGSNFANFGGVDSLSMTITGLGVVTYTGGADTANLFGISSDPTGVVSSTIIQSVTTTTAVTSTIQGIPDYYFNADYLRQLNNQIYLGSYSSGTTYISSKLDWRNYLTASPAVPGSADSYTFSANGKGIGIRQGIVVVGYGTDTFVELSFTNSTVANGSSFVTIQTLVPKISKVANLATPYAHEFIDMAGDNILYLSQDQQLRTFSDTNNAFVSVYPSLSQVIYTELTQQDFTGGGLKCIADFIYITAPNEGKVYPYQNREDVNTQGQVVNERIWHSPFEWNATRVDVVNGIVVAFSNYVPQIYNVWDTDQWWDDSPSGEQLPYTCVLALSYRTNARRQGLLSFDKLFTEGYMTPGTPLQVQINYNYLGAENQLTQYVNSTTYPATFFQMASDSLGDTSLGDDSLGMGGDETVSPSNLLKYKVINSMALVNCFEYQPIYYTNSTNSNWQVLAVGTNATVEENQESTFLINQQ